MVPSLPLHVLVDTTTESFPVPTSSNGSPVVSSFMDMSIPVDNTKSVSTEEVNSVANNDTLTEGVKSVDNNDVGLKSADTIAHSSHTEAVE
ncbi:hypothetical protein V6N11_072548 [Hibiscus sabdariffa]|uniref:Uncharacterized protein n=1 Tax=Hibiscus sabdariffa TaxID=183260 RepID=A0ABR2U3F8_9ROSI